MFLNAVMLAGLSAAVLPIVLHLLSRARYRRVEWGAMIFLEDTRSRQLDRSRLARYLLLLLRVLAIAAIALAFARPVSRQAVGPASAQRMAVVIVMDRSPSMSHPEHAGTRFELARRAALGVLGQLKRGDQVGLVSLGEPSDRDVALTTDLQDVASRLASMQPSTSPADHAEGVRRAESLLSSTGDVPAEVFLIGDRQGSAWRDLEASNQSRRSRLRVVALPVGSTQNANAWIESAELVGAPAIAGQEAQVEIRIRNGGDVARNDLPVSVSMNDRPLGAKTIYLGPGATEVVRLPVTLGRPGEVVLKTSIGESGMPQDDTSLLAIDVAEPISVLAITGESPQQIKRSPADDYSGDTDYLRLALTPYAQARARGQDAFRFRIESEAQWPEWESKREDVIVLSDVTKLDAKRIRAIEQFVFAGGGLLLVPGPRTDAQTWNDLLYRGGRGVAPAPIDSVRSARDEIVRLVGITSSHEVFGFYAGRPDPLPPVSVLRWMKFAPVDPDTVLATLQSGDPLILQRPFGRGRVVATAIPLDADWSNLAFSNLYLPTMQSIVRWLGSATVASRNVPPQTPIEHTFDSPRDRNATLLRPDGQTDRVPISISGGSGTLVYPDTDLPGTYTIRTPGEPPVEYVVRAGNAESELDLLDDDQLDPILAAASIERGADEELSDLVGRSRKTTELSMSLLAIGLALLGCELLLAQRSIPPREVG